MSSYGDFIALSDVCDACTARIIKREVSDGVIAPGYTEEALEILKEKRKGTYNVIEIDPAYVPQPIEHKDVFGITFEQGRNNLKIDTDLFQNIVSQNKELPENAKIKNGKILVNGEEIAGYGERRMRELRGKLFSMVFQNPMTSLNPTMTVGAQIAEAVRAHQKDMGKEEVEQRVTELMQLVGIEQAEERKKAYPYHFSGGMRQRVVLAIALAGNPEILFADEPTTALDVTIQAQILDLLREIQKKLGTATVFVTHDLGVVARIADRVAVMYAGKIVEIGTVDEIFYDPRHPYTWGLLRSIPAFSRGKESLPSIPGMPPSLLHPPKGDAFASRNAYALEIDFEEEPPMFRVTDSHYAATWLLDERAPKVVPPIGGNTDGT